MAFQIAIKRGKKVKSCLSEITFSCGGETIEKCNPECQKAPYVHLLEYTMYMHLSGHVLHWVQERAPAGMLFTVQKSDWIDKDLYLRGFNEVFLIVWQHLHSRGKFMLKASN